MVCVVECRLLLAGRRPARTARGTEFRAVLPDLKGRGIRLAISMNHAGGKELVQNVLQEKDPTVGTLQVQDIRVTESVLTDDGPAYATIESFEL
ncbi:hypothetical protein [Halorhabdus sp. CBA1104]|uniref:hypothetical protein n=1 Tax=Halorhabdus sp. CBA1104 TaxID=1380432 RepID=UPI0018A6C153|nr:hypothetical protein [Halorhabdus sp. CBA1104]